MSGRDYDRTVRIVGGPFDGQTRSLSRWEWAFSVPVVPEAPSAASASVPAQNEPTSFVYRCVKPLFCYRAGVRHSLLLAVPHQGGPGDDEIHAALAAIQPEAQALQGAQEVFRLYTETVRALVPG